MRVIYTPGQPMESKAVRLPPEVWRRLQTIAARRPVAASALVREAVDEWLARHDTEQETP